MKIYDNKNPDGKKIERGNKVICPECQGRDGRHVLSRQAKRTKDKNGDSHVRYENRMCTRA